MKKTLVMGANPNPSRYSYLATEMLKKYRHEVVPFGNREGEINGTPITTHFPEQPGEFDTVTLYMNPVNQQPFIDKILELKPRRIIFNPGTENPEFIRRAEEAGIQAEIGCTLVMLNLGIY